MALDKVSNFAKTTITGITSGATEVVLDDAINFLDPASGEYNCVIWEISNYGNPADDPNKEIVRATALSGNTLTITRAQEGTTASNHNTGGETYAIANVLTSKMITDIEIGKENSITYPTESPETKYYRGDKTFHEMVIGSGGFAGNVYPSEVDDAVIAGYKQLGYTPDASETEKTIVVNNNTVTGLTAIYPDAVGVELIPSGTWRAVVYAKASSTIGDTTIKLQVFKRTSGGVETDLFEMESETIENTADYALFRFESSQLGFATNTTDRLGARIKGATTRTSDTTITYIIGNGRGLYFNTTLPTRHDTLRALNEDDNFLHVTSNEKSTWSGKQDALGLTPEDSANKKTDLTDNSDTYYPTQKAVKTAVDAKLALADKASTTEINTGTEDNKYITPDQLAGSNAFTKTVQQICVEFATDLAVADGVGYIVIPAECNGMNLISARADVITAGTTNASTFDIYNVTDSTSMLSSAISIASGAKSGTGTVDEAHDDVATGDIIRIDVDTLSTTKPKGLIVTLAFRLP